MIKSIVHANQPDWFEIDEETARQLHYLAGDLQPVYVGHLGMVRKPSWRIHRTHLPLLKTPEALALIGARTVAAWEARDKTTKPLGFELRVTQQQALDFIEPRRGVLLADDMRIGKTLSAIMSHDPSRGQLVIVAPLSTRAVWLGWLRRVFPGTPIGICIGKKFKREDMAKPIVFIHYDIIHAWQILMPIGTLVLDEAHYLVGKDTKRTNAAVLLASRAKKVVACTGTPIWNLPAKLWPLITLLAPGAWGGYYDFGIRYGLPVETGYGVRFTGISNEDELKARMSELMIRRLWKDCQDLPPISRSIIISEIDEPTRRRLDILAAKLRSERTNTAGSLAHYRSQLCKHKIKTVVDEVKKIHSRGEPCVVWTWHKEFAENIGEALEDAFVIHGEISADKREERMDAWRKKPDAALVATMACAQVGIDLSHAHLAIFAELDYTPAIIGQAEMRTFSPDRPMHVMYVVANHLVDQRLVRALVTKLNASDPLGLAAAVDAIDAIRLAIDGPDDEPDMVRFFDDLLSSAL